MVAQVVDVDAQHHGGAVAQWLHRVEQFGLAMEAAVAGVGDVVGVGQLVVMTSVHRRPHSAASERQSSSSSLASEADTAVTARAVVTQFVVGHPGEERRIGPAAERDDHRRQLPQPGPQGR